MLLADLWLMAVAAYTFEAIADLIGLPVSAWPASILAAYQKPTYTAPDRLKICIFNYLNGFDNHLFLEFAVARGALRDAAAIEDVRRICEILQQRHLHLRDWFSFNLQERRWMYLDGTTRYY